MSNDKRKRSRDARRSFLGALYGTLRAGIATGEEATDKAARNDAELGAAFEHWKAVGLHGSVGLALYRRGEGGRFAFVRFATQVEDDAFIRLHHTTLAAVLVWRGAAASARAALSGALAELERERRVAREAVGVVEALLGLLSGGVVDEPEARRRAAEALDVLRAVGAPRRRRPAPAPLDPAYRGCICPRCGDKVAVLPDGTIGPHNRLEEEAPDCHRVTGCESAGDAAPEGGHLTWLKETVRRAEKKFAHRADLFVDASGKFDDAAERLDAARAELAWARDALSAAAGGAP